MQFQEWECLHGCGHIFLSNKVSLSKRPHKPLCPNCGHKETLIKKEIHEIDLEKTKKTSSFLGRIH